MMYLQKIQKNKLFIIGILLVFICYGIIILLTPANKDPLTYFPLKCPIKLLTGIACPTCGLGHSIYYLFRGEIAESLRHHLFGIPLVSISLITLISFFINKNYVTNKFDKIKNYLYNLSKTKKIIFVILYIFIGYIKY